MACTCYDVGEAGAGSVAGGVAVDTEIFVAAPTGNPVVFSSVATKSEEGCWFSCNRFGDVSMVKAMPLFRRSSGSAKSHGGMS